MAKWATYYEHKHHISYIKKVYDECRNMQHAANQLGMPYNELMALRDLHGWPKKLDNKYAKKIGGKRYGSLYQCIESEW